MTQVGNTQDFLTHYFDIARYQWLFAISIGVFVALFLLLFQPFGVNNMDPTFHIGLEFALAIGVSPKDVALMDSRLSGPDASLNAPIMESDGNSADRQDFIPSLDPLQDEIVGDEIDRERRTEWLNEALGVLNERELKIIRERRLDEDGATLEALGDKLGISKERVRQIESRAMEKLRDALVTSERDSSAYI